MSESFASSRYEGAVQTQEEKVNTIEETAAVSLRTAAASLIALLFFSPLPRTGAKKTLRHADNVLIPGASLKPIL
jgi:hypothetical protein